VVANVATLRNTKTPRRMPPDSGSTPTELGLRGYMQRLAVGRVGLGRLLDGEAKGKIAHRRDPGPCPFCVPHVVSNRKLTIAAVSTVLVFVALSAWWFLVREISSPPMMPPLQAGDGAAQPVVPQGLPDERELKVTPAVEASDNKIPTVAELREVCGSPWSAVPGDPCAEALDARYLDEYASMYPLVGGPMSWVAHRTASEAPPGPSWREIFIDPPATRKAVEDALSRPECLAGQTEACAVDEIVKLALLHEACIEPLRRNGFRDPWRPQWETQVWFGPSDAEKDERWQWNIDVLDADASLTVEEYWRARDEVEEAKYRYG